MKCHRNEMEIFYNMYVELASKMHNSTVVCECVLYYLYMRTTLHFMFQLDYIDNMQFSLLSNSIDALFEAIIRNGGMEDE